MSGDWHIVDDDDEPTPELASDDDRLNLNRVRLIALERRAANRSRQWAIGAAVLALLAALALVSRAVVWRDGKPAASAAAFGTAMLLAVVGAALLRKLRRRLRSS